MRFGEVGMEVTCARGVGWWYGSSKNRVGDPTISHLHDEKPIFL